LSAGQKAETSERTSPASLQKIHTKLYEVAGDVLVDIKLKSGTSYVRCFEVIRDTRQQNTRLHSGHVRIINWHQFLIHSETFCCWDKQQCCWDKQQ